MSITLIILLITCAVSIIALTNKDYFYRFQYNPFVVKHNNQWYRVFSHALIHANWLHLFFNMYVLYNFGQIAEYGLMHYVGARSTIVYLVLYIGGVAFAALPAFMKHSDNEFYNSVGASGAVSAVLFSAILFIPSHTLYIFGIIPIPAFLFGFLYLFLEAYLDKRGGGRIAHDAHLWGALFGIGFTILTDFNIAINFTKSVNNYLNSFF